jgi:hypothetical protein
VGDVSYSNHNTMRSLDPTHEWDLAVFFLFLCLDYFNQHFSLMLFQNGRISSFRRLNNILLCYIFFFHSSINDTGYFPTLLIVNMLQWPWRYISLRQWLYFLWACT